MIIYIHGFASCGFGSKAQKFKEYFEEEIITISLPTIPNLAIDTLEQIIEFSLNKDENVYLIGSSLGGFYSLYLANKYDLKAVLINPAINPWNTLHRYEGVEFVTNYYDNSRFEFTQSHINSLKNYKVEHLKNSQNFITLLQEEDEVLDFNEAAIKLEDTELIVEEGGSHSFDGIERYFRKINSFFYN
ncbi:YqiA/YcfP family alpha/beta fold hydrolase [Aliarcobacter butzleri]|uniref:YqiA/YcfP family alpha/beta fold hydrolase n=1 Tax=Aliarcobacter butzleri TaxID=28197 RepID=UPI0021B173F1|nr:YqiA/YcfP family alpha/beta fold hydrolase [Aliarcobacter butzleri]MCT7580649.1 esterase [Aliarcobacter butzleri]